MTFAEALKRFREDQARAHAEVRELRAEAAGIGWEECPLCQGRGHLVHEQGLRAPCPLCLGGGRV